MLGQQRVEGQVKERVETGLEVEGVEVLVEAGLESHTQQLSVEEGVVAPGGLQVEAEHRPHATTTIK